MRKHFAVLGVAAAILAFFVHDTVAQNALLHPELPNFQKVNERIYRGGQPQDGGFDKLAQLGVRVVVNLRDSEEHILADKEKAATAGIKFFSVPMAGHARPTDEQVNRVLSILKAEESHPVFIYCRRGKDRTGTVTAIYRITEDGWTGESAIAEANERGMFVSQFEMRDFISDYYCSTKGTDDSCEDRPFIDRVGAPTATATRRVVSHSITKKAVKKVKRIFR